MDLSGKATTIVYELDSFAQNSLSLLGLVNTSFLHIYAKSEKHHSFVDRRGCACLTSRDEQSEYSK